MTKQGVVSGQARLQGSEGMSPQVGQQKGTQANPLTVERKLVVERECGSYAP